MDVRDRRRVPIAGVIVGGFLLGAGVFGLYRVADAQPLPPPDLPTLPPASESALPPPAMPTLPALPPIEPAAGNVPPVAPPAVPPAARPAELKPQPVLPEPTPLPPTATQATPVKPPVESAPSPKLDPVPSPAPAAPTTPDLPPVLPPTADPIPKPVEPPPAGLLPPPTDSKPAPPPAVVPPPDRPGERLPPAKPESNLRPELPPPNVTQNDAAGRDLLPSPVVSPPTSPAPGATAMTLSPHKTLLSAAAGAALAFTPMVSQAQDSKPGAPPAAVDAKAVEALDKKVKELTDDIKKVREEKERLELLVNGAKDGFGQPGLLKRLERAEADLKAMDDKMKSLEEKLATKTTSEKTTLPAAMVGKGKVVLVNEFRTKLSVMVNGTSYPLDPSQTKDVLVGAGEFTYELVEFPNAAPVKSPIKEGETVTLRIK